MRRCLSLSLLLIACNPHSFDDFVAPSEVVDAGAAAGDAGSVDAALPPEASVDAEVHPARDASSARDGETANDNDASIADAGMPMGSKDSCGQLRPAEPMRPGVEDGGVVFAGAIAQTPSLAARTPSDVALLGGRYWWVFGPTFKPDSLQLATTDSLTWSTEQQPYALDEAGPNAPVPSSFIPTLEADRMMVANGEQLSHLTGSLIAPPLFGDPLLFYAPSVLSGANNSFHLEPLGTRVATVRINGTTATVTPKSQLLFGPDKLAFRFGLRDGGYVYLYGCQSNPAGDSDCMVARAQLGQATDGASYQFRAKGSWSNDYSAATFVLFKARHELSVSYNEFLHSFLAVHLRGLESVIVLQTAPRPEGPWEILDEIAVPPPADGVLAHFAAVEHPELSTKCGRKLVITYFHGSLPGELRRVEVTLREAAR